MLSHDLVTMLQAGAALLVGTVSADGVPRATRAWGIRIEDAARARVVVDADDPVTVANLPGGLVAVTGADVRTFRSVQLKGRVVEVAPPTPADVELAAEHADRMFTAIWETDRTDIELQQRLLPRQMLTIVLDLAAGFDQTPGPEAGTALGASA